MHNRRFYSSDALSHLKIQRLVKAWGYAFIERAEDQTQCKKYAEVRSSALNLVLFNRDFSGQGHALFTHDNHLFSTPLILALCQTETLMTDDSLFGVCKKKHLYDS